MQKNFKKGDFKLAFSGQNVYTNIIEKARGGSEPLLFFRGSVIFCLTENLG
jgi:hypothetical protein